MNDLRLIILGIGLCIIVFIYLWETGKQRRQNRRQTINYSPSGGDKADLNLKPDTDPEPDYSSILSDLNEALNKTRKREDEDISRMLESEFKPQKGRVLPEIAGKASTGDLFVSEDLNDHGKSFSEDYRDIGEENIISLYVTSRQGMLFSGNAINDAAEKTGLEFGELNIFHNFSIGGVRTELPLYSVADMYEPGSFDLAHLDSRNTRGLTLFMCLPCPVDGELVLDSMLSSATELAEILGGEVRGPDRQLINESHITSLRRIIRGG